MASTYLDRTPSAGNRKKWTFSAWFKKSTSSASDMGIFTAGTSGNDEGTIKLYNYIDWIEYDSGTASVIGRLTTTQVLRDTSAWYHLVCVWDSANATAGDRMKMYLNGEEVTSFSTDTNPTLNYDSQINNGVLHNIGRQSWNSSGYFDGSMTHVHFCDGQAYQASDFGEYDANGVWKIKTSPSVTYGTNGFFILKDGNSVTDQSGNGNNFTVAGGTLTNTEDNPSNVFATANPNDVMKQSSGILKPDFSNGNLTITKVGSGENVQTFGTIAVTSGKWYWETKASTLTGNGGHRVGVFFGDNKVHSGSYYYGANAFYIHQNGKIYYNGSTYTYMSSISQGDIVNIALDRTNGEIYLGKNGQWSDGAGNNDQTFANAVGIASTLSVSMPNDTTYPFFDVYDDGSSSTVMDINFGNGYFGTTAVASAGTNASGIGIFEYDVPTGYTALSTKGLNL